MAQETRYDTINLGVGVNSVAAEQAGAALRTWQFTIGNTSSSNLTDAQVAIDSTSTGLDLTNPSFFGFVYANPSNPSSPIAELPSCPAPSTSSETCPSPGATITAGSPGLAQEMTVYSSPSPATGFAFPDGGTTGYDSSRVEGAVTGNDTAYAVSITLNDPRYEVPGNDNQIVIGTFSDNVDPTVTPTVTATTGGVTTTVPLCPQAPGTTCVQGAINVNPNGEGTGGVTCYSVQTNLDQAQALTQYSLNLEENETTSGCPSGDPGVRIQAASQAPPSASTPCTGGTDCAVTLNDPTLGNVTFSVGPDQVSSIQTVQTVQYVLQYAPSPAGGGQATVSGTLTDPSGSVIPSPFVAGAVACPTGETPVSGCPGGTTAIADPTSGFYSMNVAPGSYNVLGFSLASPNPTPGVSAVAMLNLNAGDAVTQDFTVPYPPDVLGTVTDPSGSAFPSPIQAGAVACPTGETFSPNCPGGATAIADSIGSYSMSLAPGSYVVVGFSSAPGNPNPGVSSAVVLTVSGYSTILTQNFAVPYPPTTATVSGTVTNPNGNAFPSSFTAGVLACPTGEALIASCPGATVAGANSGGSYSLSLSPGTYNVVGFSLAPGNPLPGVSAVATLTVSVGESLTENFVVPDPSTLTYTGPTQGALGDPVLVSATLTNDVTGNPVAGETVNFGIGLASCSATTNSSGSAACILTPVGPAGSSSLTAGFAGNSQNAATGISTPFTVLVATCSLCVLSPSVSSALSLTGNGSVSVSGSIAVNSSGKPAATLTGNGKVTATQIGGPGAPAQFKVTGNGRFSPTPVTESAVSDPLAALPECPDTAFPPNPCSTTVQSNVALTGNGSATINPGIYQSISLTGNGKLILNPGVYVITGSLSVTGNGSISGSGVTLYFACSAYPNPCGAGQSGASFSLTGNGTVNLSAPTSGHFQGVSIFVDRNNTATDTLTGNGSTIGGTIYAKSANLTLTGNGNMVIGRLIVNTLTLTGNGSVAIG